MLQKHDRSTNDTKYMEIFKAAERGKLLGILGTLVMFWLEQGVDVVNELIPQLIELKNKNLTNSLPKQITQYRDYRELKSDIELLLAHQIITKFAKKYLIAKKDFIDYAVSLKDNEQENLLYLIGEFEKLSKEDKGKFLKKVSSNYFRYPPKHYMVRYNHLLRGRIMI